MALKRRGVSVVFVTGDVKDDWWRKERGEVRGPLPELVYEMRVVADVHLFMLRPASLLIHARDMLGLEISKESVQDAQRVSSGVSTALDDKFRISLINLTSELLAMLEDLYLASSNTNIVRALRRSSMELYDALRDASVNDPVEAVWVVINKAAEFGLMGGDEESRPEVRLGNQSTKLRLVLDRLYVSAMDAWLNQIVNQYMGDSFGRPQAFSYGGPLPPMIVEVKEQVASILGDRQRSNFVAVMVGGREFATSRIVAKFK